MRFPFEWKYTILSRIKILARLLRLDIRYGIRISPNQYIIVKDKKLFEIDIKKNTISSGYPLVKGSRPLNMVNIDIDGFDNSIYYGECVDNPGKTL
jgi:hypothetical protein